jgi:hypothetical protein
MAKLKIRNGNTEKIVIAVAASLVVLAYAIIYGMPHALGMFKEIMHKDKKDERKK